MPSQVLTKRRVKRRQQRLRLVSKNAKRKVRSVRKHRKTAKKVMRGGAGFNWTKVFNVQDQISCINPEIAKEPEVREDVFTISIKKSFSLLYGSSYNIQLSVDLDKYPGLIPAENGPYENIPFKYKNLPFMSEFSPQMVEYHWKDDVVTPERSNGREDINIILNALVYFLFRNTDISEPTEIKMLSDTPLFNIPRLRIGNLGNRPDFKMVLLLGGNYMRMVSKLKMKKIYPPYIDINKANGLKCIVDMRLYYDSKTKSIKLEVDSYSGFELTKPMFKSNYSLGMIKAERVITEMSTNNQEAFFKELETKLTTLGQEKGTFYQGGIDYVMVPNEYNTSNVKNRFPKLLNVYFTFDEPTEILQHELETDRTKMEAFINSSLQACQELKGKKDAMDDKDTEDKIEKCITFMNLRELRSRFSFDPERLGVTSVDKLSYILEEHNKRLVKDYPDIANEIFEMKKILDDRIDTQKRENEILNARPPD
jgi:hypothetical protein